MRTKKPKKHVSKTRADIVKTLYLSGKYKVTDLSNIFNITRQSIHKIIDKNTQEQCKTTKNIAKHMKTNIIRKRPCVVCGKDTKIEAHPFSYDDCGNVVWMCHPHHKKLHNYLKKHKVQTNTNEDVISLLKKVFII